MAAPTFVLSDFQKIRQAHQPTLPLALQAPSMTFQYRDLPVKEAIREKYPNIAAVKYVELQPQDQAEGESSPLRVGVVLSGGQAPGGHNVIMGVYDYVKRIHTGSQVFGFLGGPRGIFTQQYIEINDGLMNMYRNQGGFDMICSGRDKIETPEQYENSLKAVKILGLNGLVIIGGDDSNTNAALLADYFIKNDCACKVVGCPKTIDGDLKNEFIEISFGFDTACKVYSEVTGNLCVDALSSKKYYHFIRLMGRSASHIALQCALATRPNICLVGEEVQSKNMTLQDIVKQVADIIMERANRQKGYGVLLVPEGLIEFIPEVNVLIRELNEVLTDVELSEDEVRARLTDESRQVFNLLPDAIRSQLLLDRDPHGNVQVAKIETERLLILLLKEELPRRGYPYTFLPQSHYFGYEGRCALPSEFDSSYCYGLGQTAGALIRFEQSGVMAICRGLKNDPSQWQAAGVPLAAMMDLERRRGKDVAVITKALVELDGPMFKAFEKHRQHWAVNDCYRSPGPIQFFGPGSTETNYMISDPTDEELFCPEDVPGDQYAPKAPQHLGTVATARAQAEVELPSVYTNGIRDIKLNVGERLVAESNESQIAAEASFANLTAHASNLVEIIPTSNPHAPRPKNIGIAFLGRHAPGGHNIIDGLLRATQSVPGSKLYGFVGGNTGIFQKRYIEVTEENFRLYRNQGGFDFLGRAYDQIRTPEEYESTKRTCQELDLDGLVLVGATHTLTDAALLSEKFLFEGVKTKIIGVPASVDNNVGHPLFEACVGFDTASRVNSQLIGNMMTDSASATKYWYFIRLMGRDPSHLAVEAALQTHPNVVLISEQCSRENETLKDLVNYIANCVQVRAESRKLFGCLIVPEGLLQHLSHFRELFTEISHVMEHKSHQERIQLTHELLTRPGAIEEYFQPFSVPVLKSLPTWFQEQLLTRYANTGAIALSQIETERLLAEQVGEELKRRKQNGQFKAVFSPVCHFFGYQGRCSIPSLFDCSLASSYGLTAAALVYYGDKTSGYMVTARGLNGSVCSWKFGAIPLVGLMRVKGRSQYGQNRPVIPSKNVELTGQAFQKISVESQKWLLGDHYTNPGPIQFFSPESSHLMNLTLQLNHERYSEIQDEIRAICQRIQSFCRFGAREELLNTAKIGLSSIERILNLHKNF